MLGIAVVILATWLLLRFVVREPFEVLGVVPTRRRLLELLAGTLFMALVAVINFVWQAQVKEISYQVNPDYGLWQALNGSFWIFRAVLFEELVFRGVLLYLLIRYLGVITGCLVSSVVFGVYHWFSYEVLGERWILMAYIFLVTGAGGWMFAFAFAKTKSLYAPVGLHFGWNFITAVVFSAGPIGSQLLLEQGEAVAKSEWYTLLFFSLQAIVAPGLVTWYLQRVYRAESPADTTDLARGAQ